MERITLDEFIEDIREGRAILRDGYELGLIIDESDGRSNRLERTESEIAKRTSSVSLAIDDLLAPSKAAKKIAGTNGGETLVLLKADRPLLPEHYKHLQSLVSHHALEEWHNNATEREMVRFNERSRFVLVLSRGVLEGALKSFAPLRGILGISFSLDDAREKEVA